MNEVVATLRLPRRTDRCVNPKPDYAFLSTTFKMAFTYTGDVAIARLCELLSGSRRRPRLLESGIWWEVRRYTVRGDSEGVTLVVEVA